MKALLLLKKRWFTLITFLVLILVSCSKNNSLRAPTKAELLAHKWYLIKIEDTSTSPPTETFPSACSKQGYMLFLEDGTVLDETFFIDPNTNTCTSNGLKSYSYELLSGDNKIVVTIGDNPPMTFIYSIVILTDTELVLIPSLTPNSKIFLEREP